MANGRIVPSNRPAMTLPISAPPAVETVPTTAMLAEQAPWWEPGSKSGYHAVTQGNLVGEVVRRVDGRLVGRFFAEEIAGPLDADFFIGTPAEHDHRVARVIPATPLRFGSADGSAAQSRDSIPYRASNPRLDAELSWDVAWRRAEIPAASGQTGSRHNWRRERDRPPHGPRVRRWGMKLMLADLDQAMLGATVDELAQRGVEVSPRRGYRVGWEG